MTLVETAARIARDEEWNARGDDVRDTARKLRAGGPATGAPSLARVLRDGDRVVGLLRLWLCLQPVVTDGKQYSVTADGLVWHRPERLPVPLTNFKAQIVADVVEDDGAETRRLFLIEAGLNGRHTRIKVPAAEFSAMTWPTEHLGATAVVYPGQGVRDHARAAIQLLSDEPPERRVYTHLGWRLTDGRWIYLHAGGAIGPEGAIAEIEVAPPEALNHFRLPVPPTGVDLVDALRASVTFLDVAPDAITVPVFAAIWRAVLGSADFSVHLAGPTGVGKTELAALAQQHFGADLHARHLPASWASTGNALEGLAFAAKDALLVVDDYSGAAGDVQRLQREADRLLRAQGNSLGRQRMRPDATLKPPKPPRGLILSTGEDVPHGHSLRARLLILQVGPNAVNWSRLTAAQQEATAGRFASALAAFVRWLAPRYTELRNRSLADVAQRRQTAVPLALHRRTPGIVGGLVVALGVFLEFAESVGAMGHEELAALANRARTALSAAGAEQSELHAANEVTRRFLALVGAAVAGGRAHVAGAEGEAPPDPEGWGWRQVMIGMPLSQRHEWRPQGERAGWIDGDDLYLEPDVAFAIAQRLARDAEEPLVISPSTLKRRLLERGLLKSADRARMVYTVRRTLNRVRREVLHLSGDVLSLSIEKPDQPDHADARSDAGREPPAAAPLGPTTKRNDFHETSPLLVGLVGSNEQDTGRGIGEHDDGSATPPTTIATPPTAGPRDRKDLEDRPAGGAPHPDNLQQPLGPCPACAGTRFWRSVAGVVVCATCHPPAFDSLVAGWLDAARADTGGGGAHATPKEGDPGC